MTQLKITLLLLSSIVLFSCSRDYKLERAKRKIVDLTNQYPELITTNTIIVTDTIIRKADTVKTSKVTNIHDTIVTHIQNITTRVIRNHDTITVFQTAKQDTVIKKIGIKEKTIEFTKPAPKIGFWQKVKNFFGILKTVVILLLIALVLTIIGFIYIERRT